MKRNAGNASDGKVQLLVALFLMATAGTLGCARKAPATEAVTVQATFATPAEAAQALQDAARTDDENRLARILGPESKAILSSGDPAEDKASLDSFVSKFSQMNRWVAITDGSQVLNIGADNYPFPIPLVRDSSSEWRFDTAAGKDEILARRIGRNELLAIDATSSIANAEELYFQTAHDGGSAHEYTSIIISNAGKQDGLYWASPEGQPSSPLGKLDEFAPSELSSATPTSPLVIDGYSFRILNAQAGKAKGGAKNYMVNGKMTRGFAVIATPVKYRDSGIMTFILSREGVVYQKDLGQNTVDAASSITAYNPEGWTRSE